ncbi:MAG: TonB family protein [Candidatus Acidiferrales bacterium]
MPRTTNDAETVVSSSSTTVSPSSGARPSVPVDLSHAAAVCVEIPLEVHGSQKPAVPGGPVEPFHEETRSVIVFPNGGVIRLSASVAAGQMLAVTNQNTQRGMLCRVLNVRNYPNLKGYVELEFTQPLPGFWGVSFPEDGHTAPVASSTSAPAKAPAGAAHETPQAGHPADPFASVAPEARVTPAATHAPNVPEKPIVTAAPPALESAQASRAPAAASANDFWKASFPEEFLSSPLPPSGAPLPNALTAAAITAAPAAESASVPPIDATASGSTPQGAAKPHAQETPAVQQSQLSFARPVESAAEVKADAEKWPELLVDEPVAKTHEPPAEVQLTLTQHEPKPQHVEAHAELLSPVVEPANTAPSISVVPASEPQTHSDSMSPAVMKELERLALAHVGDSTDSTSSTLPERTPEAPAQKSYVSRESAAPSSSVTSIAPEPVKTEPAIVSHPDFRPSPLHSFTAQARNVSSTFTPPAASASQSGEPGVSESAPPPRNAEFGSFLQDPEPRTSSPRVFTAEGDLLGSNIGETTQTLKPLKASHSSVGSIFVGLVAGLLLVGGGAWYYLAHDSGATTAHVVAPRPANVEASTATETAPGSTQPSPQPSAAVPTDSAAEPTNVPPVDVELTAKAQPTEASSKSRKASEPLEAFPKSQPSAPAKRPAIPEMTLTAPNALAGNAAHANAEPPPDVVEGASANSGAGVSGIVGETASNIPPPSPSASENGEPVRVGGKVKEPRLIASVQPEYPAAAKQFNVQGDVQIEATIDPAGRVTHMRVISGPAMLQRAAMDALKQWRYEPSKLDDKAVAIQMNVTIKFRR